MQKLWRPYILDIKHNRVFAGPFIRRSREAALETTRQVYADRTDRYRIAYMLSFSLKHAVSDIPPAA